MSNTPFGMEGSRGELDWRDGSQIYPMDCYIDPEEDEAFFKSYKTDDDRAFRYGNARPSSPMSSKLLYNIVSMVEEDRIDPKHAWPSLSLMLTRTKKRGVGTATLRDQFLDLSKKWREETIFTSSMTEIVLNDAYQQIIGMGPDVLPYIFDDLQTKGGHWFWALRAITRENPVKPEDVGNIKRMTESWLEWARCNGDI